ncbi:MAG: hypothetical protein J3K34DRAFT_148649 [Monoraphidium minutum]|nr:MAG: hypothetical protein J3K34DRAFT_148649 [Monoraphidium minutum]
MLCAGCASMLSAAHPSRGVRGLHTTTGHPKPAHLPHSPRGGRYPRVGLGRLAAAAVSGPHSAGTRPSPPPHPWRHHRWLNPRPCDARGACLPPPCCNIDTRRAAKWRRRRRLQMRHTVEVGPGPAGGAGARARQRKPSCSRAGSARRQSWVRTRPPAGSDPACQRSCTL